ncbi:MAG: hypothetical protein EBW14_11705, partial [Oxalobacteraceae bacterium]|nr:hypothetical protein [Oxalobacteraceae bacterium]
MSGLNSAPNIARKVGRARQVGPAIVFGIAFLALWESAVRGFDLKPYFLAAPTKIFEQFIKNYSRIWEASMISGGNALVGLVVGTFFGVAMSFILSRY